MLLNVPSLANVSVEADWVEVSCLFGRDATISREELTAALTAEEYDDDEADSIIEDSFGEIDRRRIILGDFYPVCVDRTRVVRLCEWKESLSYSFMLLLATNSFHKSMKIRDEERATPSKLFERLTAVALKNYLRRSINIGSPRDGRMAANLKAALVFFCKVSNERIWERPEIHDHAQDEGVDVIAWSPLDSRSGQLILLTQCTIERDWVKSGVKLDLATWEKIMNFATPPHKAMAFPHVCSSQWKQHTTRCGMLFDRLRIASLFPMTSERYLRAKIIGWATQQISRLEWFT
jgi:hypothetical protein